MLTATVRGPRETFQKKLRSNPSSASDLEFPAEKHPLGPQTANAPTHNGQNDTCCPTRSVFQQYVGASAVLWPNGCFSLGSFKSNAEEGLGLVFFEIPPLGPAGWQSIRRFDVRPSKYRFSSVKKASYCFGAPQKNCSKINKFQKVF